MGCEVNGVEVDARDNSRVYLNAGRGRVWKTSEIGVHLRV